MGNNLSTELASGELNISMRDSIAIQLRSNHYPPVPLSMIDPCIEAINACNEQEYDKLIELPEGISWRGETHAPASAIVEGHHLEAWCNHDPFCDCYDCIGEEE